LYITKNIKIIKNAKIIKNIKIIAIKDATLYLTLRMTLKIITSYLITRSVTITHTICRKAKDRLFINITRTVQKTIKNSILIITGISPIA